MLRHIRGKVEEVGERSVVLDVGGLGFLVQCSRAALAGSVRGESTKLFVALQMTEGAPPTLFGFASEEERALFEVLTLVKGVGGKIAMALFAQLDASAIANAIRSGDATLLATAQGIGRKLAERLCFELAEKMDPFATVAGSGGSKSGGPDDGVVEALMGLGFSRAEAREGISAARESGAASETQLLQGALARLQRLK